MVLIIYNVHQAIGYNYPSAQKYFLFAAYAFLLSRDVLKMCSSPGMDQFASEDHWFSMEGHIAAE
jgi:hypothetical protein